MSNTFYNVTGRPTSFAAGRSYDLRTEFAAIAAGFDLLPNALGAGQKGFSGGTFQGAILANPTITGGNGVFTFMTVTDLAFEAYATLLGVGANEFGMQHVTGSVNMLGIFYDGAPNTTKMRMGINHNGSVVIGDGTNALATNATDGFLHIPRCAGTPSGAATAYGSSVPMVYDSTANKIWVRSGGSWRQTAALT